MVKFGKTARIDIRLLETSDKWLWYDKITLLWERGHIVNMMEHESGFPAVTIDVADIHILTDVLSCEQYWGLLKVPEKWHESESSVGHKYGQKMIVYLTTELITYLNDLLRKGVSISEKEVDEWISNMEKVGIYVPKHFAYSTYSHWKEIH